MPSRGARSVPGSSAASWSASTEATSATLLLSPTGSRYVIGTMPDAGVYDITP